MINKILTVATVCYNSERTLVRSISSVLKQLTDEVEYIFIDGKSTDGTLEIIKKYSVNKDIRYISEHDFGIYDAMNKAINLSSGKWIWFVNSDDMIEEGAIEVILNTIKKNSDASCIYGNLNRVSYIGGESFINTYYPPTDLSLLKRAMSIPHPCCICKVSDIRYIKGFDLNFKLASDWDLILRLYLHNPSFIYIDYNFIRFFDGGASAKWNILERHAVRKKNLSYKIVDFYFFKDFIAMILIKTRNYLRDSIIKRI